MPRLKLVSSPVIDNASGFTSVYGSTSSRSLEEVKKGGVRAQENYASGPMELDHLDELPNFVRHEESTNIELFYDLFFVANLTTFSLVHEVNSKKTLTSYIGFFAVLWFTWCQTSLFDVRFIADSFLERLAKALHLGVMVGLAIVGPKFDTADAPAADAVASGTVDTVAEGSKTLQTMALVLMASRIILGCQYFLIGFHVRGYKNTKVPFGLLSGSMFLASIIYLMLSFFGKTHSHTYRAFYTIAAAEMVANISISSIWKVVSFKHTHLVERMSLLTLYILGEGVIDVLKSIGLLAKTNDIAFTPGTIGVIFSACTIIYILYMLYFDCLNKRHFGSIRQQIWAFAHFPFHAVLVLALTGMAQLVKWNSVLEAVTGVLTYWSNLTVNVPLPDLYNGTFVMSTQDFVNLASSLNQSIFAGTNATSATFTLYKPSKTENVDAVNEALAVIKDGFEAGNNASYNAWYVDGVQATWTNVANSIFNTYAFEVPEELKKAVQDSGDEIRSAITTIGVVFTYFFIAAGFTLVFMGAMSLVMDTKGKWTKGSVIRFVSHLIIGTTVSLIAILKPSTLAGLTLMLTPWMIPIFLVAVTLVLVIHHIKWGKNDKLEDSESHESME